MEFVVLVTKGDPVDELVELCPDVEVDVGDM